MRASTIASFAFMIAAVAASPGASFAQGTDYALRFDGRSDFVTLAPTASLMAATWPSAKTVSLWVNPSGTPFCSTPASPATCDAIFGDRPRTWGISRGVIGGNDRIWVWNYDGTMDTIGVPYTAGQWTHIALVHGGGVLSAYKNGSLVSSIPSGNTMVSSGQALQFGGVISNSTSNWTFEGDIDELQIWNTARTALEIGQTFGASLSGSEAGLAAYYRMSNGSGTSLTDNTGRGWTGAFKDGGSGVPADGPIAWVTPGPLSGGGIPTNTPPVADAQSVATDEDVALGITLTGSDADNNPLTYRVIAQPSRGTLSGAAPNLSYAPGQNLNGTDSFVFVVNDGYVDSAPQTVSISVAPVNDPPVAGADTATTTQDTQVVISVLGNDTDVDGGALVVTDVGVAAHGVVTHDGVAVTYLPTAGYTGPDSFTYTVSDGSATATGVVSVNVRAPGVDPGYAIRFDGVSDIARMTYTATVMGPGWESRKTVSLWLKPTGTAQCISNGTQCDEIFGDTPEWWGISRGPYRNGPDKIWVWNFSNNRFQIIGVPYVVDQWMHLAMVHENGVLSAYKNGVLVGSVASGSTQQPSTGGLPILGFGGLIMGSRAPAFSGEIDELALWNVARTPEQLQKDMHQGLVGDEPGLRAYYRMSNGSGMTVTDDTGHGFDATLYDGLQQIPADGPPQWVPSGAFSIP